MEKEEGETASSDDREVKGVILDLQNQQEDREKRHSQQRGFVVPVQSNEDQKGMQPSPDGGGAAWTVWFMQGETELTDSSVLVTQNRTGVK